MKEPWKSKRNTKSCLNKSSSDAGSSLVVMETAVFADCVVNGSRDTAKFRYLWPLCIYEFKLPVMPVFMLSSHQSAFQDKLRNIAEYERNIF